MTAWIYASIGDHLSIDEYTGVEDGGAASLLFHNVGEMWPDYDGLDLASTFPNAQHEALAINGTSLENILRDQLPELPKAAKLVTVTAGTEPLLRSLTRFAPGFVEKDLLRAVVDNIVERYNAVLEAVRKKAPDALIIYTNLYDPTDNKGKFKGWYDWPGFPAFVKKANERLAAIGPPHGAKLADIHKAFKGHGMASPADRRYLGNVMEVNARGAHEIRTLWWAELKAQKIV
ncbi:MAG: SGNH/GDSL hydrolase family protein [Planctomycetota bacterium]